MVLILWCVPPCPPSLLLLPSLLPFTGNAGGVTVHTREPHILTSFADAFATAESERIAVSEIIENITFDASILMAHKYIKISYLGSYFFPIFLAL
jgi:hypothetical protein